MSRKRPQQTGVELTPLATKRAKRALAELTSTEKRCLLECHDDLGAAQLFNELPLETQLGLVLDTRGGCTGFAGPGCDKHVRVHLPEGGCCIDVSSEELRKLVGGLPPETSPTELRLVMRGGMSPQGLELLANKLLGHGDPGPGSVHAVLLQATIDEVRTQCSS